MKRSRVSSNQHDMSVWDIVPDDDGEAAFWDEFNYQNDLTELELSGKKTYQVKLVDRDSGEEYSYPGLCLEPEVLKLD